MCIHAIITKDVYICYEDDLDEDDLNLALIILFQCVDICTAEPCVIDRQMKSELLQYLNYMQCSLGYSNLYYLNTWITKQ